MVVWLKKKYVDLVKKLNLNHRVRFVGRVPYLDLISYTAGCDIGWAVIQNNSMSNNFALPNKFFEYLLAGLPVVASRLPNIEKIFNNYNCGALVQDNNVDEHILSINRLNKSKEDSSYYVDLANKNFTWESQDKVFKEIFNN